MKKIYISKRNDRLGMRLYAVIRTIYYCQKQNLIYRHVSLSHNKKNYKKYDELFGFNKKYKTINKKQITKDKVTNLGKKWGLFKNNKINYKKKKFIKYRKSLIKLYKKSSLYKNVYNNNNINICVHYRRGDCNNYQNIKNKGKFTVRIYRYTPDNFINNVIDKLNIHMDGLPIIIHIHSDSKLNLNNLITKKHNFKIQTHFNESEYESLNAMIQCDILFRYGISSFSGVAAFYNTNITISEINNNKYGLYKYNNVYNFSNCDNILSKLKNNYIKRY